MGGRGKENCAWMLPFPVELVSSLYLPCTQQGFPAAHGVSHLVEWEDAFEFLSVHLEHPSPPYHLPWSQICGSCPFSLSLGQSPQHHRTQSDFKVSAILNKEDLARVEMEKFALGSLARGESTNLNKTFLRFQGFPGTLQETPHFLVYSLKTFKREHVSFPLHMKTACQSLSNPFKWRQGDTKLRNLPASMFEARRPLWCLMPRDRKPAPSCRKDALCSSCVAPAVSLPLYLNHVPALISYKEDCNPQWHFTKTQERSVLFDWRLPLRCCDL